jgi:hypothetical protein
MLNHEQLSELKHQGHTSVRLMGTPSYRDDYLRRLKEAYAVEEKNVYYSVIYIIREKK